MKKTGPFDSNFIAIAENKNMGDVIIRDIMLIKISVKRLMTLPCLPIIERTIFCADSEFL